ncbi:MAG: PQQ-binding-like beta-propeller repeat protein [Proteobacteria bacterium]|nr:PQQ-binding-like beta-propeller repeat protein [Pseudomonadota bacterium]
MNKLTRLSAFSLGLILSLGISVPVQADDTEIYRVDSNVAGNAQPNILFILDTSGSMNSDVDTVPPFQSSTSYAGVCDPSKIYYREGTGGSLPDCATTDLWVLGINNHCDWSKQPLNTVGLSTTTFAQYDEGTSFWGPISTVPLARDTFFVECENDSGIHGENDDTDGDYWAKDGGPWDSEPAQELNWSTQKSYTIYDGNYLNYAVSPPTITSSRIEILKQVTKTMLSSISGVNIALMRFSNNHKGDPFETRAQGGMIIHEMVDVTTGMASLNATIDSLVADGFTPLSEAMYEAGLYYQGLPVDFGLTSENGTGNPLPSIPASRMALNQSLYESPVEFSCQENFIVLITDGRPTADQDANARIESQPNFNTLVGASCDGAGGEGACLDDAAAYLFNTDVSTSLAARQYVTTYTVGFTIDIPILQETANDGGGRYFIADDAPSLASALVQTVLEILDTSATFTAPSISVNAFNRTRSLNDVFVSVFESSDSQHWPGNLKKYALQNGVIVDKLGNPAINPITGFFADSAQSFWSAGIDGGIVTKGGAALELPNPSVRNLYTYTGSYPVAAGGSPLTSTGNQFASSNSSLTSALLNIGNAGDPTQADLIDWARGIDVTDEDGDGDVLETRFVMGDPMHAKPASVIYGGTAAVPDINDAVIFTATNDGYVHALDMATGAELWSFIPQELLPSLKELYVNPLTPDKHYGVDGNMRTLIIDVNRNGIIEPLDGDKIHLYFGQRRGGKNYFALDVTAKNSPILMWVKGIGDLPHLSQTWSTPTPARVNIAGASQNVDKHVLIFGGGYDPTQDNTAYSVDLFGNTIYMLDAISGDLLWWAGNDPAANLTLSAMNNSIAADIRVLDIDSDGFADRMYAADMGGRVFRFDISNGLFADSLVAGGVFASLGAADLAAPAPLADTRRFYYAPDTAIIAGSGQRYLSIALGSGYRAHPLETGVADWFYALRDYDLLRKMTQLEFDAMVPITQSDPNLIDISLDPAAMLPVSTRGWKLNLSNLGEKVLAESRTFDNKIFFTTFSPQSGASACSLSTGVNRLYAVNAVNASPFTDLDQDGDLNLDIDDRSRTLKTGGIAPEVVFLFPSPDDPNNCVGKQCTPDPECIVGLEVCNLGFDNDPIRTFWNQDGAE